MRVYEVQIEKERGKYERIKTFSSKKKAINYILSHGECNSIRIEKDIPFNDKWYKKEYMNEKEWNKLINEVKGCYHISEHKVYFINKIEVE